MGCGVNPKMMASNPNNMEMALAMNMQLDKWNSRQIFLVKSRFKVGLSKQNQFTLDAAGLAKVFPQMKFLHPRVRDNVFRLFDKDMSSDVDFKEFCYVLTMLIHGSKEEQADFVGRLFDVDRDGLIGPEDMKLALLSTAAIKQTADDSAVTPEELARINSAVDTLFSSNKTIDYNELVKELENSASLVTVFELFEIIPSPLNEYRIIRNIFLRSKQDKTLQSCHILSYRWWNMWRQYVRRFQDTPGESPTAGNAADDFCILHEELAPSRRVTYVGFQNARTEDEEIVFHRDEAEKPGEIDNSDLEGSIRYLLREGLRYMRDYVPVPNEAWKCFLEWYGGGPEFERTLILGTDGKYTVELYPPLLYVMLAGEDGNPIDSYTIPYMVSKKDKMNKVIDAIKSKFGKDTVECRVWYRFMINSNWELIKDKEQTVEELGLAFGDKLILESMNNGSWPREKLPKNEPQWSISDKVDVYLDSIKAWKEGSIVEITTKMFRIKIEKDEAICVPKNSTILAPYRTHTTHNIQSILTSDVKQKLVKEFKPLVNLGNTCYMNAILQCVVHTPLLGDYFASGLYQNHVSKKGSEELAGVVAEFCKEYESANDPIASLRKIKTAIGKYIPQFQGYDQHDAQEFLAMMLDKLNGELTTVVSALNLAKTAPSGFDTSTPTKTQEESAKVAETEQKVSVMDDLFCGEMCTSVTCPMCNNVSEKRESFYYLSVPLPQEDAFIKFTCIKRCNGEDIPPAITAVSIKVQKTTRLESLLDDISLRSGIDKSSIMLGEVARSKIIRKVSADPKSLISSHGIRAGLDLYAYEVCRRPEQCKVLYPPQPRLLSYEPGELADVFDPDSHEWKVGKIQHKPVESARDIFVVVDVPGRATSKEIKVGKLSTNIAPFMSRTANYNEIEVLPMYHRCQRSDGSFGYFGTPKLMAVGAWATCNQVVAEVILQVKHFRQQEQKQAHSIKIKPFITIMGSTIKGKQTTLRTPVLDSPKQSGMFKVTMIDTSTDTCAICNSRQITAKRFAISSKPRQCRGCNILDYGSMPIKSLVNYFGNVALCVDWKMQNDYEEPKVRNEEGTRPPSVQSFKPSLDDCLKLFTAKEKISCYKCDNCNKESTADLQVLISKLPDILIIHLKRFQFTENYVEKLAVNVNFPLHKLSMSRWLAGVSSMARTFAPGSVAMTKPTTNDYDLYAVANHHSCTASGGHYTAYIQSQQSAEVWVECDDQSLRGMSLSDVATKDAYLLFYKRRVISASNIINLTVRF